MTYRTSVFTAAVLCVMALAVRAQEPGAAGPWPGWRGPDRNGISTETGLLRQWPAGGPEQLWHVSDLGIGFSSVAVAYDTVYVTGVVDRNLVIHALTLDGQRRWQTTHGEGWNDNNANWSGARSTPTLDDGRLYVISGPGKIGCYNAADGKEIWTRTMDEFSGERGRWGYAESVLIVGNHAVITPGGRRSCIAALDKTTGATAWTSPGNGGKAEYSSCIYAVHDGVPMIINGTRAGLVGVDARNGNVLWKNDFSANNTANCPTPVYVDGYVFWANGYGKGGICLKLTAENGGIAAREAWRTSKMVCHHGGYVVLDGYIYGNHNAGWSCLELATGDQQWFERGVGKGSIAAADGLLFLFAERGGKAAVAAASPDGLTLGGEFAVDGTRTSWAHPVIADKRLYLRYDNNLYCFDIAQ